MPSILIIDDESNIRKLGQTIFSGIGYDVHLAEDGTAGLQKAIELTPDIILLDVIMPNKNGFDTCKEIRQTKTISDIPIIMVSAMGDEYNKITGFEGGADDYVTKPYNIEELKARVNNLIMRYQSKHSTQNTPETLDDTTQQSADKYNPNSPHKPGQASTLNKPSFPIDNKKSSIDSIHDIEPLLNCDFSVNLIQSGLTELDSILYGGLPQGSNILVTGPIGKGKSSFARQFITQGLNQNEKCLFIAIDDDPNRIRSELSLLIGNPISELESDNQIQFVDAYSWSSLTPPDNESFAIHGALELNQLSGVISDSSGMLGQSVQQKCGGRRVIDSISSFFINFDLASIQRFLNQITRTSVAFGNVTTLFILEQGTISEQTLNNIKYIMDGVIEFDNVDNQRRVKVSSMKWTPYLSEWKSIQSLQSNTETSQISFNKNISLTSNSQKEDSQKEDVVSIQNTEILN